MVGTIWTAKRKLSTSNPLRFCAKRRCLVRRLHLICAAVCGALISLALPGCGDARSSADRAAGQGILLMGNNAEPQSLDPHKGTAVADGKIISTLLEGLVRPDAHDSTKVHPGMAERWEHDADAGEWTFHLREAYWSDGAPVTAHDFVYAYRRLLHPEFGGRYAEMLYPLKGAQAYNRGKIPWEQVGVSAPDAHTLVLRLEYPTPHLLRILVHYTWYPVPAHHIEKHGGMLDRRSEWTKPGVWVGNGAYLLQEHRYNDYLSVTPNPRYWRAGELRNRGIRFLPIVNGYTETRMYFGGKLHITNNVPPEMIDYARARAPKEYCQDAYYSTIFYRLNINRKPLSDARVRRALSLAVDREALVNRVVRGAGTPAYSFTPPSADYQLPPGPVQMMSQAEREAEARRLLAEAGFPGGKGFPTLELMTTSRDVQRVTAETVQAMWARVLGVHVEIRSCEWTAYKTAQQNGEYDISSSTWSGDYLDPATFLELWREGAGNNCTGWASKAYDALLNNAMQRADAAQRCRELLQAEQLLQEDSPVIPLYWNERTYMKSPSVNGWSPLLIDNHPLDAVELTPLPEP